MVQFLARLARRQFEANEISYPTNKLATSSTRADFIPCAVANFATGDAIYPDATTGICSPLLESSTQGITKASTWIRELIFTAQGLLDQ